MFPLVTPLVTEDPFVMEGFPPEVQLANDFLRIHAITRPSNRDFYFYSTDPFVYFQSHALDLLVPDVYPSARQDYEYTIIYSFPNSLVAERVSCNIEYQVMCAQALSWGQEVLLTLQQTNQV